MQIPRTLKFILTADALSCLGMGTLLAAASAPLSSLFGLPDGLVLGAGLALLPVGLFILAVANRREVAPLFVWAIISGNCLWVVESLILVASTASITALGTAFVLAQAALVAALTAAEIAGLLQARKPTEGRAA